MTTTARARLSRLIYEDLNRQDCWFAEWYGPQILKALYDGKCNPWYPYDKWTPEDHAAEVQAYIIDNFRLSPRFVPARRGFGPPP